MPTKNFATYMHALASILSIEKLGCKVTQDSNGISTCAFPEKEVGWQPQDYFQCHLELLEQMAVEASTDIDFAWFIERQKGVVNDLIAFDQTRQGHAALHIQQIKAKTQDRGKFVLYPWGPIDHQVYFEMWHKSDDTYSVRIFDLGAGRYGESASYLDKPIQLVFTTQQAFIDYVNKSVVSTQDHEILDENRFRKNFYGAYHQRVLDRYYTDHIQQLRTAYLSQRDVSADFTAFRERSITYNYEREIRSIYHNTYLTRGAKPSKASLRRQYTKEQYLQDVLLKHPDLEQKMQIYYLNTSGVKRSFDTFWQSKADAVYEKRVAQEYKRAYWAAALKFYSEVYGNVDRAICAQCIPERSQTTGNCVVKNLLAAIKQDAVDIYGEVKGKEIFKKFYVGLLRAALIKANQFSTALQLKPLPNLNTVCSAIARSQSTFTEASCENDIFPKIRDLYASLDSGSAAQRISANVGLDFSGRLFPSVTALQRQRRIDAAIDEMLNTDNSNDSLASYSC